MIRTMEIWPYIAFIIVYYLISIKPISNEGIACYKCMTTDSTNDACQDPFSSIHNPLFNNCQATSRDRNGSFPARFCVKISGRIVGVDGDANTSYLNTMLYYRTCIVDNIMESTKSFETSGSFRLQGLYRMAGSIRLQGHISLCTHDGCNHAVTLHSSKSVVFVLGFLLHAYFCPPY